MLRLEGGTQLNVLTLFFLSQACPLVFRTANFVFVVRSLDASHPLSNNRDVHSTTPLSVEYIIIFVILSIIQATNVATEFRVDLARDGIRSM